MAKGTQERYSKKFGYLSFRKIIKLYNEEKEVLMVLPFRKVCMWVQFPLFFFLFFSSKEFVFFRVIYKEYYEREESQANDELTHDCRITGTQYVWMWSPI